MLSLGSYGHGAGTTIGRTERQDGVPIMGDYPLHYNTCYSVEVSSTTQIPEWDGGELTIGPEDNAAFTEKGIWFLDGRQENFYLIH